MLLRINFAASEKEVALGHGKFGGRFATKKLAISMDIVSLGIDFYMGCCIIENHAGLTDAATGVAHSHHAFVSA